MVKTKPRHEIVGLRRPASITGQIVNGPSLALARCFRTTQTCSAKGLHWTRAPAPAVISCSPAHTDRHYLVFIPIEVGQSVLMNSDSKRLLVSLATYNESGNLRDLVAEIRHHAPHAHVLVIDDNSPDGTGAIADELKATLPDIHVIHRSGKQGLGTAILTAMRFAIDHDYNYYLNMDADFSHPPRYIPNLLAGMDENDVMIGSRYVPGGGVEGEFNLKRKFMSTGINWYARLLMGLSTKDNSGSFRCYRVSKLSQIDLNRIRSRGYSFMEEILFWCKSVGCKMGETPILFENRRAGVSKINKGEAVKALWIIARVGADRALSRTGT